MGRLKRVLGVWLIVLFRDPDWQGLRRFSVLAWVPALLRNCGAASAWLANGFVSDSRLLTWTGEVYEHKSSFIEQASVFQLPSSFGIVLN